MYKFLISALLLTVLATATSAGDKKVEVFGMEPGANVPEALKSKVDGKMLKEVTTPSEDFDTYYVFVKPVGTEYQIEFVTAHKTFGSLAAGKAAYNELFTAKQTEYGVNPGDRFEANGGSCVWLISYNKKMKRLGFTLKWRPTS